MLKIFFLVTAITALTQAAPPAFPNIQTIALNIIEYGGRFQRGLTLANENVIDFIRLTCNIRGEFTQNQTPLSSSQIDACQLTERTAFENLVNSTAQQLQNCYSSLPNEATQIVTNGQKNIDGVTNNVTNVVRQAVNCLAGAAGDLTKLLGCANKLRGPVVQVLENVIANGNATLAVGSKLGNKFVSATTDCATPALQNAFNSSVTILSNYVKCLGCQ